MKRILNVFLIMLTIGFSGAIFAADSASDNYESINPIANVSDLDQIAVEGKCGVVSYSGKEVVSPRDFSVCENDISYSILEIIFQKVINENEILSALVDKSDSRAEAAYSYNIGGPIISVIESVTWLTFMFSGVIFSYVAIKTLNISASSGKFMRDWNSVYVMTRTLGAMAIIFPIGSFSIAQTLILVFAIFAIMGANYVWGAFLSMQTAQTMILSQEDAGYLRLAQDQAESIALTNVCSVRTAALSLELYKSSNPDGWFSDEDNESQLSRLSNCSRNYNYMIVDQEMMYTKTEGRNKTETLNALPMTKLVYGSPTSCKGSGDTFDTYDKKYWGSQYFCGEVSFAVPSLDDYLDKEDDLNGWFSDADNDIADAVYSFKKSFDAEGLYYTIKDKAIAQMKENKTLDTTAFDTEVESLKTAMVSKLQPVYQNIKERIASESDSTNPPLAYEALMIATNAAFGNLMGGYYNDAGYEDFWAKVSSLVFSFEHNKLIMVDLDSENKIGYSPLYVTAKEIALLNMSAHCARNWRDYMSSFDSTKNFLTSAASEPGSDFDSSVATISSNCIVPIITGPSNIDNNIDPEYYHPIAKFDGGKVIYALTLAGPDKNALITLSAQDANAQKGIYDAASKSIIDYSNKKAKELLEAMSAYYFVVRSATAKAMEEMYQQETDDTMLIKMRDLGWASAGGFILTLANNGSDLNSHSKQVQSSVSWGNSVTNDKALHTIALESEAAQKTGTNFLSMDSTLSKVYRTSISQNEVVTVDGTVDIDITSVFGDIENFLTSPMRHLKYVGGFDQNKTLREGAKACYEGGQCKITEVHPVTALMTMGNEIIEISFWVLVAKAITGTLAYIDVKSGGGKVSSGKNIIKMFFSKSPLGMLLSLGAAIDPLMKVLAYYIIPPIFTVGIFFSFIVPMMPFLAFLMGFIGWIMLILELLIAVNVWVIMMATPDANGTSRADPRAIFNFAGQLLLKPALMIIALVFGWYLSAISIYFLNMTIFGALSPTESKGISGLFDIFMFYTVYLIMIFVAIKHSFKIIEILPDKIFGLLNINSMNDIKSDSLGMERLIQLAATQKVLDVASIPGKKLDAKKDKMKLEIEKARKEEMANKGSRITDSHNQQAADQEKMDKMNSDSTGSENKKDDNASDKKLGTDSNSNNEPKKETTAERVKRLGQEAKEKRSSPKLEGSKPVTKKLGGNKPSGKKLGGNKPSGKKLGGNKPSGRKIPPKGKK